MILNCLPHYRLRGACRCICPSGLPRRDSFSKGDQSVITSGRLVKILTVCFGVEPLLLSCAGMSIPTYEIWTYSLIIIAETDFTFPVENRRKAVDILIERKATYHLQLFSTVKHGFAIRGDPDDPIESKSFGTQTSCEDSC